LRRPARVLIRFLYGLFLCRGFWDDREGMLRTLAEFKRSGSTVARWQAYYSGKTVPEHLSDTTSFYQSLAAEIKKILGVKLQGRVLEVGCGNGALLPFLEVALANYKGLDFSESMIAELRGKYDGVAVECCEGSSYIDNQLRDLILSVGVVQHFNADMLNRHFESARSMLKPDGVLFCGLVPDLRHYWRYCGRGPDNGGWSFKLFAHRLIGNLWSGDTIGSWYTQRQFARIALRHGLKAEFRPSALYWYTFHAVLSRAEG
jgi:cyclopropane fatty-acyl-phospholipid synthase-like methyltransferase